MIHNEPPYAVFIVIHDDPPYAVFIIVIHNDPPCAVFTIVIHDDPQHAVSIWWYEMVPHTSTQWASQCFKRLPPLAHACARTHTHMHTRMHACTRARTQWPRCATPWRPSCSSGPGDPGARATWRASRHCGSS